MKGSRVDLLEKKIEALIRVVQQILDENNYLKDLAVGTLETVKKWKAMNRLSKNLKKKWLQSLVRQKKLTPVERLSSRLGYMGTSFMMMSPHLLPDKIGMVTYVIAGIISIPQVFVAKQWNLVAVNLNVAIAYIILYLT